MRKVLDAIAAVAAVFFVVLLFPLGILLAGLPVVLLVRLLLEIARRF
jgi:hypothetical protein